MKFAGRAICFALVAASWFGSAPVFAKGATNADAILPMPPPMPVAKSPVSFVRELLAMSPGERRLALSNRPPEIRNRILAKVREYQSLKPDERELRLRATELEWYLQPLMAVAPTNRTDRLQLIPEEMRKLVGERLTRWDLLPPRMQEDLLNNEMTARYFTQLESASEEQKQKLLGQMSPERRAKLETGLDHWRELSADQRDRTLEGFNAFFELTSTEKDKALRCLSDTEQRQMEKTLAAYENLPVAQRTQCIHSFEKFAGMKLEERQAFLKNAERWKLMSPAERQSWRELVNLAPLMPLMPPRIILPMPPTPSKPLARPSAAMATNSN
jgi:hypothetical protein